jgi:transcriptional regulator with PAS, ATPase and Fis domain
VIGALGIVLFDHPETTLQPLIQKFAHLQRDLDDARRELASQRRSKYTLASFVGTSPPAVEVKRQARRAAQSSSPGAPARRNRHRQGTAGACDPRRVGSLAPARFVSVNIAAVPDTLLEAEFFGVAPGAYTGADRKGRDGKFKLADGGTLFLDEIGDMPLPLQAKLLRALQEGEIEPLGSNKVVPFDARVIAATSRDLAGLVRDGKFREDLYYRLNVLPIRVPPLRERRADIPALPKCWARTSPCATAPRPRAQRRRHGIAVAQAWRGNIRELRNVLEQAAMRSDSQHIEEPHLEQVLREAGIERVPPAPQLPPRRRCARRTPCGRWRSRWPKIERAGDPGSDGRHQRQQGCAAARCSGSRAPSSTKG